MRKQSNRPTALFKHLRVQVTQGKMTKTNALVPQWEAHLLLALWGDDAAVIGEEYIERRVPEVRDEYQRLADKYGPRDDDNPYVAKVYGNFGPGIRTLEQEIQVSVKGASRAPSPVPIAERAGANGVDLSATAGDQDDEGSANGNESPDAPLSDEEIERLANAQPTVSVTDEDGKRIDSPFAAPEPAADDFSDLTGAQAQVSA